jgi:uncharacterized phage infection (PIP) family protein YhgE
MVQRVRTSADLFLVWPIAIAVAAGCGSDGRFENWGKKADDKVSSIGEAASEKYNAAKERADEFKERMARMKADAKERASALVDKVQTSAEAQEREATRALKKAREAYKTEGQKKLEEMNTELERLRDKASDGSARAKARVTDAQKQAAVIKKKITRDISAFDDATLETFAELKAELNAHLDEFHEKVDRARNSASDEDSE